MHLHITKFCSGCRKKMKFTTHFSHTRFQRKYNRIKKYHIHSRERKHSLWYYIHTNLFHMVPWSVKIESNLFTKINIKMENKTRRKPIIYIEMYICWNCMCFYTYISWHSNKKLLKYIINVYSGYMLGVICVICALWSHIYTCLIWFASHHIYLFASSVYICDITRSNPCNILWLVEPINVTIFYITTIEFVSSHVLYI